MAFTRRLGSGLPVSSLLQWVHYDIPVTLGELVRLGMAEDARVPPGQFMTEKFPVLTYGATPRFDPETWTFRIFGAVENSVEFTYLELLELDKYEQVSDFHCVTQWSRLGNRWEGISVPKLMELVNVKPEGKFVLVHCDGGYTTNLPLDVLLGEDVMLANRHEGEDLTPDHGWPLRLIVPKKYAWKSAKWIRALEILEDDRPGFWETHGYHNDADPWSEERFS